MAEKTATLRFGGSLWCNLDIALRSIDQLFRQSIRPTGLAVIEWYILRALYERDGQHASELARAVGRAATSFTPNLDKLQQKGLIERRPDETDRRAVRIYLTAAGLACREEVMDSSRAIDAQIRQLLSNSDYQTFQTVVATLQGISPE